MPTRHGSILLVALLLALGAALTVLVVVIVVRPRPPKPIDLAELEAKISTEVAHRTDRLSVELQNLQQHVDKLSDRATAAGVIVGRLADLMTVGMAASVANVDAHCASPCGMAYNGTELFVANSGEPQIVRIDPATNGLLGNIATPGKGLIGVAWDGTSLWCSSEAEKRMWKLSVDGKVLAEYAAPGQTPTGLAFDGKTIYVADRAPRKVHLLDPASGKPTASWDAPGPEITCMDFKDGSLWCTDSALARIYKLEPATGKVIEQYDAPSRDVRGICWVGTDLWVSDQNTKRLIKVKLVDFRKLLAQ